MKIDIRVYFHDGRYLDLWDVNQKDYNRNLAIGEIGRYKLYTWAYECKGKLSEKKIFHTGMGYGVNVIILSHLLGCEIYSVSDIINHYAAIEALVEKMPLYLKKEVAAIEKKDSTWRDIIKVQYENTRKFT
jgi:hypothetical protein